MPIMSGDSRCSTAEGTGNLVPPKRSGTLLTPLSTLLTTFTNATGGFRKMSYWFRAFFNKLSGK